VEKFHENMQRQAQERDLQVSALVEQQKRARRQNPSFLDLSVT
jgi:hypothetical protein